jgi:primosomal protein N' (replication factor Y)
MPKKIALEPFSCLSIAVSAPVKETFFYAVSESLRSFISIGTRVVVPLNNRSVTGYVLREGFETPEYALKEIEDILSPEPLFPPWNGPFF